LFADFGGKNTVPNIQSYLGYNLHVQN